MADTHEFVENIPIWAPIAFGIAIGIFSIYKYTISNLGLPENYVGGKTFLNQALQTKLGTKILIPLLKKFKSGHKLKILRKLINSEAVKQKDNPGVVATEILIENIPCTFYQPAGWKPENGTLIYFHGGGYSLGQPHWYKQLLQKFAVKLNLQIIAPDYRKAFENPWPAPYDDCYTVLVHLIDNATVFGINLDRYMISGDSAGGQLTISTSMNLVKDNLKMAKHSENSELGWKLRKMPIIAAPIYPVVGLFTNGSCPCQKISENHPFLPFNLIADFTTWMAGIEYDTPGLQKAFYSNCWQDEAWFSRIEAMRNKYLSEFYGFEKFPEMRNLVNRAENYIPKTEDEKKFVKTMKNWVKDYKICQMNMSDEELAEYLTNGPKCHFYLTCEHDMLRDEGIVFYKWLEEVNLKKVNVRDRKVFKHYDCKGAPHGMVTLCGFGGGKTPGFDVYMEKWIEIVKDLIDIC